MSLLIGSEKHRLEHYAYHRVRMLMAIDPKRTQQLTSACTVTGAFLWGANFVWVLINTLIMCGCLLS